MLNAYSQNTTIAADGLIPFTSVTLQKGNTAVMSGSTSVQLNRCGVYEVNVVVSGTPAVAGEVTITMLKNGVAQPQATATVTNAVTTVSVIMPISTLVQVSENNSCCCCSSGTTLQFVLSAGLNVADTSIVVTKVC